MGLIDTAYIDQFNSAVMHLSQQGMSKLDSAVLFDTLNGDRGFYEQLGPTDMVRVTQRNQDTPIVDPDHQRRMVVSNPFSNGIYRDNVDAARILIDATGNYARAQAKSVNRLKDQTIIDKFNATVYGGKDGTTSYPFDPDNVIPAGGTGMTLEKLLEGQEKLRDQGIEPESSEMYLAVSSRQMRDLLNLEKTSSNDYNEKVLQDGIIVRYLGMTIFTFGTNTKKNATLPVDGAIRSCFMWAKEGMLLAMATMPTTSVDLVPTKRNIPLVQTNLDLGATRMEESQVIQIDCDET